MENSKEHAIQACQILNGLIGDLVCSTIMPEYFDSPEFKAKASDNVIRLSHKMADSFLFLALAKWVEFYDRYRLLIPSDLSSDSKQLRKKLEQRGVLDFRNQIVGHIWSKKRDRPLLPYEIEELDIRITQGNPQEFLKWINDPQNNSLGKSVVGTIEAVRDSIMDRWSISNNDLSFTRNNCS